MDLNEQLMKEYELCQQSAQALGGGRLACCFFAGHWISRRHRSGGRIRFPDADCYPCRNCGRWDGLPLVETCPTVVQH